MHEISIAERIVEIVRESVDHRPLDEVRTVRVAVGALSGVDAEALTFSFSAITGATPLERSVLDILWIPVTVRCADCRRESQLEDTLMRCPQCGGMNTTVLQGRELEVREIELEDIMMHEPGLENPP
jgi:hydrogenase nickel incorporation protein HypA/HybF